MTEILGCDYSDARPDPGALYAAGVRFAVRYVSAGHPAKLLLAQEYRALTGAGLDVVGVYEAGADWMLGGRAAGVTAATIAAHDLTTMTGVVAPVVYFAADWDVSLDQVGTVLACIDGATRVLGHDRVGIYGGRRIVAAARDHDMCRYRWQTLAWSDGQWLDGAQLRQTGGELAGFPDVDRDVATSADFGRLIGGDHDMLTPEEHDALFAIRDQIAGTHGPGQRDLAGTLNTTLGVVQHLINMVNDGNTAMGNTLGQMRAAVLGAIAALPTAHLESADRDAIANEVVTALQDHGIEVDKNDLLNALAARLAG